ncbi:MAG: Gmad2 immunoglobulin-like domain-containing protein [Eubacteriales bacterium]
MKRNGKNKFIKYVALLALLFLISSAAAGCGLDRTKQPAGATTPELQPGQVENQEQPQKIDIAVYYIVYTPDNTYLVREVHQVPKTTEVARAAMEELVSGVPVTPGAARVLPPATRIRGITLRNGLATVDFSRDVLRANVGATGEALGIQSIVNTLTEFPGIQKVSFLVEGKVDQQSRDWWGHVGLYSQPFSRDLSRTYKPAIWVTTPVAGQKISSPLTITGSAMVFEAAVSYRVIDESGRVLAGGFTNASQGAPGRGDFSKTFTLPLSSPGRGFVEVFWYSPKDGEELDRVAVPVQW